jgi:hypothetical protein
MSKNLNKINLNYIKMNKILNSPIVLNKWEHLALSTLYLDRLALVNQYNPDVNLIDQFFEVYKEKRSNGFFYNQPTGFN